MNWEMDEVNDQVVTTALRAFDTCESDGSVDFMPICQAVLTMEDGPDKAKALAKLAGTALWYATSILDEEASAPVVARAAMLPDAAGFVIAAVADGPRSMPELVRAGRARGLSELVTRKAGQQLIDAGVLALDENLRLTVPSEKADDQ